MRFLSVSQTEVKETERGGRESGDSEWRRQRGELHEEIETGDSKIRQRDDDVRGKENNEEQKGIERERKVKESLYDSLSYRWLQHIPAVFLGQRDTERQKDTIWVTIDLPLSLSPSLSPENTLLSLPSAFSLRLGSSSLSPNFSLPMRQNPGWHLFIFATSSGSVYHSLHGDFSLSLSEIEILQNTLQQIMERERTVLLVCLTNEMPAISLSSLSADHWSKKIERSR